MDEPRLNPPRRSWFAVWRWSYRSQVALSLVVLLAMLFYPLSFGPLVWLLDNDYLSESAFDRLFPAYIPLLLGMRFVPPLEELFQNYIDWWSL